MEEKWRNAPGFANYQISIDTPEGRCRCLNFNKTGAIKTLSNKPSKRDGRIVWTLCRDGQRVSWQAARWIALTYPELVQNEYFEGAVIDHIDTNPLNNHPSNLRWVTPRGNNNNPLTKKHMSASLKNKCYTSKPVKQYTKTGVLVATYPSVREASRVVNISSTSIYRCCSNCYKTAGGYIWTY